MSNVFIHGEFGEMRNIPWINLSPTDSVSAMNKVLKTLARPITVVGHSYGAFKAMQLSGVDTLILVAPVGLTSRLGWIGQGWALIFLTCWTQTPPHFHWTGWGLEWLDVLIPPVQAHIVFGTYDSIVPCDTPVPVGCRVSMVESDHGYAGFEMFIDKLVFKSV